MIQGRKQHRLRLRPDLIVSTQSFDGQTWYVIKDPVRLRYFRFNEREYFILGRLDGNEGLDHIRREYEIRFRPDRLSLEEIELFVSQLVRSGLVLSETNQMRRLIKQRRKAKRAAWLAPIRNVLAIRIPLFDPDRLLASVVPWFRWLFTPVSALASAMFLLAAILLVVANFNQFLAKLPLAHEFFQFRTAVYLWLALAIVKVLHECGHALACKTFGGEVHEMGIMILCLTPCLYCNVSDSWMLPDKWRRMAISFAGIYVELMLAAAAVFVWWNTVQPFWQHLSLSVIVVGSVSTLLFNGNPLMRYDGYYVLADWLEIPNLRARANRHVRRVLLKQLFGIRTVPEPGLSPLRKWFFFIFGVASFVYLWVVTISILWFLYRFLKPYKLQTIAGLFAIAALATLIAWPIQQTIRFLRERGRLPEMKPGRVILTAATFTALAYLVLCIPLPISRIRQTGLIQFSPEESTPVYLRVAGRLERLHARNGLLVKKGDLLAEFSNVELENAHAEALTNYDIQKVAYHSLQEQLAVASPQDRSELEVQLGTARTDSVRSFRQMETYRNLLAGLQVRAPRDGIVLGLPKADAVGKSFYRSQAEPFCRIAKQRNLWVLVPLPPDDFGVVKDNWQRGDLQIVVRVRGWGSKQWAGRIASWPESEAEQIPLGLAQSAGGPVAVDTKATGNQLVPKDQCFLLAVAIENESSRLHPGSQATVLFRCRPQTIAQYVWHKFAATFGLSLF
ncbi:MAG: hemolysin D [Gemmatales bacterium]|nr:MAG: hemolysin D [Gemmatales bacterium]